MPHSFLVVDDSKLHHQMYRLVFSRGTLAGSTVYHATNGREGYALLDKKEATARDGTKGTTLRFGHDEAGGAHLYYVTIFVTDDWVYLVEAGGKKDLVEKAQKSIDWATQNFSPN